MTPLTPALVASVVADQLGFSVDDLRARSRDAGRARARQLAWYVSVELTPAGYTELGRLFGRTGAGAFLGARAVEKRMRSDAWTRETVEALLVRVRERAVSGV